MTLLSLIVALVLVGFVLYMLRFLPLESPIPEVIRAVAIFIVVVLVILWAAGVFGVSTGANFRLH